MRLKTIRTSPLRPLALMVMGALNEACFYVAHADDQVAARDEVRTLLTALLAGLATGDAERATRGAVEDCGPPATRVACNQAIVSRNGY